MVPLLPLILEQEYGPRAWGWFNDNAKDFLGGYAYDKTKHQVTLIVEDINADVDDNWDQSMGKYAGEISNDDKGDSAYIIDIGNIELNPVNRQRILDDESVGTMKSTAEARMSTPKGWNDDETSDTDDMAHNNAGG